MIELMCIYNGEVSVGEAAALYSLVRQLPKKHYRTVFLQLFKNDSVKEKQIFENLVPGYEHLALVCNKSLNKDVVLRFNSAPPDIVCIGGIHTKGVGSRDPRPWSANWMVRKFFFSLERSGSKFVLQDMTNWAPGFISQRMRKGALRNLFPNRTLEWPIIVPRPLSFVDHVGGTSVLQYRARFTLGRIPGCKIRNRILWGGSSFWKRAGGTIYQRVEEAALRGLASVEPQFEIWFTPAVDEKMLGWFKNPKQIPYNASYEDLEKELETFAAVMVPNKVAVISARAAAAGVPIIIAQPKPNSMSNREQKSWMMSRDHAPTPREFHVLELDLNGDPSAAISSMVDDLPRIEAALKQRLEDLGELPSGLDVIQQIGESVV